MSRVNDLLLRLHSRRVVRRTASVTEASVSRRAAQRIVRTQRLRHGGTMLIVAEIDSTNIVVPAAREKAQLRLLVKASA